MALQNQIDDAKRTVNTDSLSFSLNEFIGMYEVGEININPAFQRTFRWGIDQQSNLIESLFIGIPLPPLFVYENPDGTWELVDGLQRTSTILKFFGKLRYPDSADIDEPSILAKTKYLPDLANSVWELTDRIEGIPQESQSPLSSAQQLFLKRCRINIEVLKQPSSVSTKFDLFQRLNRGGSSANEQEVRTCLVVMKDPEFAAGISEMAQNESFRDLCQISDDDIKKQLDIEYTTRVISLALRDLQGREDLNEFLDRAIMDIIDNEPIEEVKNMFNRVMDLVFDSAGAEALIPATARRRVFTLQGLETILVGVARNPIEYRSGARSH
jgi:hypothetical protein